MKFRKNKQLVMPAVILFMFANRVRRSWINHRVHFQIKKKTTKTSKK